MNYDINTPITEAEKNRILIDPARQGTEAYVIVHVGQEPTLSEMYETIIWAANELTPQNVEFEIDDTFVGEEEYTKVFQYLTSAGFSVHAPRKKVISVPVFNEEDVIVVAGNETLLTVPASGDEHKGQTIKIGKEEATEDDGDSGFASVVGLEPISMYSRTLSLKQGVVLTLAGVVLTSFLTTTLINRKGN